MKKKRFFLLAQQPLTLSFNTSQYKCTDLGFIQLDTTLYGDQIKMNILEQVWSCSLVPTLFRAPGFHAKWQIGG